MDFPQFNKQIAEELQHAGGTSGGLAKYLDFRHIEFSAGRLVVEMDARADLLTPFGTLHGGCLSAMVDHCLGVVFYPVMGGHNRIQTEPPTSGVQWSLRCGRRHHRAGEA